MHRPGATLTVWTDVWASVRLSCGVCTAVGVNEAFVACVLGISQSRGHANVGPVFVGGAAGTELGLGIARSTTVVGWRAVDSIALRRGV